MRQLVFSLGTSQIPKIITNYSAKESPASCFKAGLSLVFTEMWEDGSYFIFFAHPASFLSTRQHDTVQPLSTQREGLGGWRGHRHKTRPCRRCGAVSLWPGIITEALLFPLFSSLPLTGLSALSLCPHLFDSAPFILAPLPVTRYFPKGDRGKGSART